MSTFLIRKHCIVLDVHPLCRLVFSLHPPRTFRSLPAFLLLSPLIQAFSAQHPNIMPPTKHCQDSPRPVLGSQARHGAATMSGMPPKIAREYGSEHHDEPNYVSSGYILMSVWGKAQEQTPWGSGELIVYWQSRQSSIDGVWVFWPTSSLDCQLIRSQSDTTHGRMEV